MTRGFCDACYALLKEAVDDAERVKKRSEWECRVCDSSWRVRPKFWPRGWVSVKANWRWAA